MTAVTVSKPSLLIETPTSISRFEPEEVVWEIVMLSVTVVPVEAVPSMAMVQGPLAAGSVVVTVQSLLSPPSPSPSVVAVGRSAFPESSTVERKSTPVRSSVVGASALNSTVILLLLVTLEARSTLMLLFAVLSV